MDFLKAHIILVLIDLITRTLSHAMIDTNTNKLNALTEALGELVFTSLIVNDTLRLADGKYSPSEKIRSNKNLKYIHTSFNKLPVENGFDKTKMSKIHFNENFNIDDIINEASENFINVMPTEFIRKRRESIDADTVDHKTKPLEDGENIRKQITNHLDNILKETIDKQNVEDSNELKSRLEMYNISSKYVKTDSDNLRPFANADDDLKKSDDVSVNATDPSINITTDILSKYLDKGRDESLEEIIEEVEKIETSSPEPPFKGTLVKMLFPMLRMKNKLSDTVSSGFQGVKAVAGGFTNFVDANARRLSNAIMYLG